MDPAVKLTVILAVVGAVLSLFIAYLAVENRWVRKLTYRYAGAPAGFAGFRIVVISDLHNKRYGKNQKKLLDMVARAKPDMIAVTGDLFQNEYVANAQTFMEGAVHLAPVYYVVGNHETLVDKLPAFLTHMREIGVHVLENESASIERGGDSITVFGLSDPMTDRKSVV